MRDVCGVQIFFIMIRTFLLILLDHVFHHVESEVLKSLKIILAVYHIKVDNEKLPRPVGDRMQVDK